MKPKIYLFDIETTPLVIYAWGTYQVNAIKIIKDWHMLSFSIKELGGNTITRILPDYPNYQRNKESDKALVKEMWQYFDKADILIGHNGDSFDVKKCYDRFSYYGLKPPSPFKTIDTLKIARKHFKFTSNKLNDLGQHLGLGKKVRTGGFDLWEDCMAGDMKAWRLMRKYNDQDVELLEKVYLHFLPYIQNHPQKNFIQKTNKQCKNCLGTHFRRGGKDWSGGKEYKRIQCTSCGKWDRQPL